MIAKISTIYEESSAIMIEHANSSETKRRKEYIEFWRRNGLESRGEGGGCAVTIFKAQSEFAWRD
jgi:hypothetical protein